MIFNFTLDYQFSTRLEIEGQPIQEVQQARLLGVQIDNKFSWQANTTLIVQKAYRRMTMLHKLYSFAVPVSDLVEVYILYIRSVLESSAVVWHSSLTGWQEMEIERVQKVSLKIILKKDYENYEQAMKSCGLTSLKQRRTNLCLAFAKKCVSSERNKHLFPLRQHAYDVRNPQKYVVTKCNTDRLRNSAIPYMQRLLNANP